MQCRLLAEADLTLKKAFQLIQGMEDAAKNAKEIQRENSTQQAAATNVVHSTDPKAKKLTSRVAGIWARAITKQCANTRQQNVISVTKWVT